MILIFESPKRGMTIDTLNNIVVSYSLEKQEEYERTNSIKVNHKQFLKICDECNISGLKEVLRMY